MITESKELERKISESAKTVQLLAIGAIGLWLIAIIYDGLMLHLLTHLTGKI